jgi:hypothetical protein
MADLKSKANDVENKAHEMKGKAKQKLEDSNKE